MRDEHEAPALGDWAEFLRPFDGEHAIPQGENYLADHLPLGIAIGGRATAKQWQPLGVISKCKSYAQGFLCVRGHEHAKEQTRDRCNIVEKEQKSWAMEIALNKGWFSGPHAERNLRLFNAQLSTVRFRIAAGALYIVIGG